MNRESGDLYIHSLCHPSSPTWVVLETVPPGVQRIRIECAECKEVIDTFDLGNADWPPD